MKNVTYENQGNNTYLVYEIDETNIIDNLSLGMINNNKISGLAPVVYTQIDNKKFLKYNISAKVSASTFLAGTANRNRILGIFSGVAKALISAEEYMLDANSILLDLDYIFVDVTTCEAELICLPIEMKSTVDVISFFKNIVFSVTYDQTENCDYVAQIVSCLNSHSSFSLINFQTTIDELNGKRINIEKQQESITNVTEKKKEQQIAYTEILKDTSVEPKKMSIIKESQKQVQNEKESMPNNINSPMNNVSKTDIQVGGISVPKGNQIGGMSVPRGNQVAGMSVPRGNQVAGMSVPKGNQIGGMPIPRGNQVAGMPVPMGNQIGGMSVPRGNQVAGMPVPNGNLPLNKKVKTKKNKKDSELTKTYTVPGVRQTVPTGTNITMQQLPQELKEKKGLFGKLFNKSEKKEKNTSIISGVNQNQQMPVMQSQQIITQMPQQNQQIITQMPQQNQQIITQMSQQIQQANQEVACTQETQMMNFGETTVLGEGMLNGETSVLSSIEVTTSPYLVRKKNGERIFIKGSFFRIGKEFNYVDYFIGDNSTISRSHANILQKDNQYYIVDTNSKNHTYVNGQMIQSNMEILLTHGCSVKLANEEFEFFMY